MKITPAKIGYFLRNPEQTQASLLYGNNSGKISIYTRKLRERLKSMSQNAQFSMIEKSITEVKKNALITETQSMSLFSNLKIITIREVDDSVFYNIKRILDNPLQNCYVILNSNKLTTKSKLNKFCEDSQNIASIGCWQETGRDVEILIRKFLPQIGNDNNLVRRISQYLPEDNLVALSEINKMSLYFSGQKHIEEKDIMACITDQRDITLDNICMAVADRDLDKFVKLSDMTNHMKNHIIVIRAIYNYFYRLDRTLYFIRQGMSIQQAIARLKPPLFFKNAHHFQRHLNQWKSSDIRNILENMLQLEITCKQNATYQCILNKFMIMNIMKPKII